LREGGARACRRRAGRDRIAALAQDRYRFGLDHEGGLRALSRPHDRRARAWWEMARRLSRPAWRDGRARRGAPRGRHRPPRARGRGPRRLHRRHLRSTRQRGRRVPASGRLRVLREILPALRQPPAGRARGPHADPRHPRRLHPCQRALVWEAREPDLYMNVFFGFPFADVPDVGMTVQAMTNGKPALARKAADDVATWAWRRREALLTTATVHPIAEGIELAKEAVARDAWPVVLADHSDRSGSATWLLQQVIAQDLADVLIATVADRAAVEAVVAKGLKAGDPFDTEVGGLADESAGQPVRIKGTIAGVASITGRHWVSVAFGRGNVVLISEYLTQVMDPLDLKAAPGFTIDQFKVFAIKSRVHFRRGFDDSGFAKTILLVEPEQPCLGTVRL